MIRLKLFLSLILFLFFSSCSKDLQRESEIKEKSLDLQVLEAYNEGKKSLEVGDVLFAGSIGRTDLPGGNYGQLIESIKTKLWPLGKDTAFIPGHGPPSNFKTERSTNPFVSDNNL